MEATSCSRYDRRGILSARRLRHVGMEVVKLRLLPRIVSQHRNFLISLAA